MCRLNLVALLFMLGENELRVDLMDFENKQSFAKYESFQVAAESDQYQLTVGSFTGGPAGESPKKSFSRSLPKLCSASLAMECPPCLADALEMPWAPTQPFLPRR